MTHIVTGDQAWSRNFEISRSASHIHPEFLGEFFHEVRLVIGHLVLSEVTKSKPNPEIFTHAAGLFASPPATEQVLVFEERSCWDSKLLWFSWLSKILHHCRWKLAHMFWGRHWWLWVNISVQSTPPRASEHCVKLQKRQDAPSGVEAGLAAGMQVCHVPDENLSRSSCGFAHCELRSLEDPGSIGVRWCEAMAAMDWISWSWGQRW